MAEMLLEDALRVVPKKQPKEMLLEDAMKMDDPDVEKANKRGFGESVKYFLGEGIIKPVARAIEMIPAQAETVLQVGLDNAREISKKQLADDGVVFGISEGDFLDRTEEQKRRIAINTKIVENMDTALETSKRLERNWVEMAYTGMEAPDIELSRKSAVPLTENYSFTKMMALGAQSIPMLGMAAAVAYVAKSPTAGAAVIGVAEAAEEFKIAREKGLPIGQANLVFAVDTAMLSALETIPMTSFMKGGKLPLRMFRGAVQEGGEEVLQGLWRDSVAKLGYDETRSLTEGLAEEFIAGFISGGTIGAFSPGLRARIEGAREAGVDVDRMREAIDEQIIGNADAITEGLLEKVSVEEEKPKEEVVLEITPELQPLIEEAKKYKTAEEFRNAIFGEGALDISNRASQRWGRLIASQVEGEEAQTIKDFIKTNDFEWKQIFKDVGKNPPDISKGKITIWRAAPKGMKIEAGDWIALTKEYADMHLGAVGRDFLYKQEVNIDDVIWAGTAAEEWIYAPKKIRKAVKGLYEEQQLASFWKKAQEEAPAVEKVPEEITPSRLEQLEAEAERRAVLEETLPTLTPLLDRFKGKVRRFAKGFLKEELTAYPRGFFTEKKEALSIDEALDELSQEGTDLTVSEFAEVLNSEVARKTEVQAEIKALQPKKITTLEITKLRDKIKDIRRGIREGRIQTSKDIRIVQAELIGLMEASDLEAKDMAKFIRTIKNIQTAEQLDKAIPEIGNRIIRLVETAQKDKIGIQIKRELKATKPTKVGQKRIGKYDYEGNKLFEKLRSYSKMTQSQAQAELDTYPLEGNTELDLIKIRFLSLKANGKSASIDIYNKVLEDIGRMKQLGEGAKNEADFEKSILREELVEEILATEDKIKANKKNIKTKITNIYRKGFSNISSMLNSMFGKNIAEIYNPEISESNRETAIHFKTKQMMVDASKIYDEKNILKLITRDLSIKDYKITDFEGLETELTKLQLMDIYNSLKNDVGKKRYDDAFGEAQVEALMRELTSMDIEFADYMQEVVQEYRDILNLRNIEITGRDLGFVENYWPFTSEHRIDVFDDIRIQSEIPTALRERAKGKVIPIPRDAWLKAQKHIAQAEHVANLSREYETLKRLFSNRRVKHSISTRFGEDVYRTLLDQIDNISLNTQDRKIDAISGWFKFAINNWVTSKVALNPSTYVRQLMSMGNFIENMNSAEWVIGFSKGIKSPKQTFDFMWKNAPFLEARFNRGYSEAIKDAIAGAERLNANWGNYTKFLSSLVRSGDITAIIYGGFPLVQSELAKRKGKMSDKQAMKEAMKIFEQATLKSQQSGLSSSLSQFQNSKNPFARLFLAFKNTANQYFRKMVDSVITYQNGDMSLAQFTKTMTIYAVIQPIMYASAGIAVKTFFKALGGKVDEEELTEEIVMAIMTQMIVSPVNAIPILDDIVLYAARKVTGQKTWKVMNTPFIDDLASGVQKLGKKEPTAEDYLTAAASVLEPATALPIKTPLRLFGYTTKETKGKKKRYR